MFYGYLGPAGTFTEEAALRFYQALDYNGVPYNSNREVIKAVHNGMVDQGVVALENTIEGTVNESIDNILRYQNLWIVGETQLCIDHHLIGIEGGSIEKIERVISHPQAISQCQLWLSKNMAYAAIEETSSTVVAVQKMVSKADIGIAAIASRRASTLYGGHILAESIQSKADNITRFVVVSGTPAPMNGKIYKTSIAFSTMRDKPGSLVDSLVVLKDYGINLTKIESRPSKKVLGDYLFLADFLGHYRDPHIAEAIEKLRARATMFRFIGSYPIDPEETSEPRY